MQNLTSFTQSSAGNITCAKNMTITGTLAMTGATTFSNSVTVGSSGSGYDVTFYGDTASCNFLWDQNGDTNGSLILGADTKSVDFYVYGATTTKLLHWDGSADTLLLDGVFSPNTSDGCALGTTSKMFSDLFLASGGVINFNAGDVTLTHGSNVLTVAGGSLALSGGMTVADDQTVVLGTTVATAETKITLEFDETTTGIGLLNMGSTAAPMVLNTNPGATVIGETVNILHSAGAGDCDDLIAAYHKAAVSGDGDSGITVVGHAARAYSGTAAGSSTVVSQLYGSQPLVSHYGTGAITAMSALSAKCDVNTGNFTASTVNAGHFHVEGAATVTGQFDGVMVEIYPDVTCLDSCMALMVDSGATVTSAIRIAGTMTNVFKLDVTTGVVTNALVPAAAPDAGTMGADLAIVVDVGGTPYYIPMYDTLHA